ncbi:hypothetical protein TNCV_3371431 [Trichonephila clavipes]|nr:hypothetical protein TNCV_3371431 [Trichonephila clavipes]
MRPQFGLRPLFLLSGNLILYNTELPKLLLEQCHQPCNEKGEQECSLPSLESRCNLATIKFTNKLSSYGLDHISRRVFDKWKHSPMLKRSSTLQLDSEIGKELNLEHSSFQKTHQRTPVSNWSCCSHVPKKKTL